MKKAFLLTIALSVMTMAESSAQSAYRKFDDFIRNMLMGGLDTEYIALPSTSWEVPLVCNIYNYNNTITPVEGAKPLALNNGVMEEVGLGIGYHGLDLVITQPLGDAADLAFAFDFYDNAWGIGINLGRDKYCNEAVQNKSMILNGYYAFNGKRYSYPASLYANYIQLKSAGSPLIAFWYNRQEFDPLNPAGMVLLGSSDPMVLHMGTITAGYGYNWAFNKGKVVLNAQACAGCMVPTLGFAATARVGGIFWINDNIRLIATILDFYEKSDNAKIMNIESNTWRAQVGAFYCF